MPVAATAGPYRDQDHRRALQSLLPGRLPRADRHHLRLRRCIYAVLPDGRAAARRLDEAASGRAPCSLALRVGQAGWPGSLRVSSFRAFLCERASKRNGPPRTWPCIARFEADAKVISRPSLLRVRGCAIGLYATRSWDPDRTGHTRRCRQYRKVS